MTNKLDFILRFLAMKMVKRYHCSFGLTKWLCVFCLFLSGASLFAQSDDLMMCDTLGTAELVGRKLQYSTKGTTLTVTDKMRGRHQNALHMLKTVPGIQYSPTSDDISINGTSDIAYQINGQEKSIDDVRSTPVNAVQRIEVLHHLEGKYEAEGVRYVVNIVLKESYTGFDLMAKNFLIISPSGSNGSDAVACEQPHLSLRFADRRWNVNAAAGYGDFNWNYATDMEKTYDGQQILSGHYTPKHPNQLTGRKDWVARVAADYTFSKENVLSFNVLYSPSKSCENTWFEFFNANDGTAWGEERSTSENEEKDFRLSVNYRGGDTKSWTYEAAAGLNLADYDHTYTFFDGTTFSPSAFAQDKRYTYGKFATCYHGLEKWEFDIGGTYTYNCYTTKQHIPEPMDPDKDTQHRYKVYAYASYQPTARWNLMAGLAGAGIIVSEKNRFALQPTLSADYISRNRMVALNLKYDLSPVYPKLFQLSGASYTVDRAVMHTGNPQLRQMSGLHHCSAVLTLFGAVQLHSEILYNRNGIFNYYDQTADGGVNLSYLNARSLDNATAIAGQFGAGAFSVSAMLGFNYSMVKLHDTGTDRHKARFLCGVSLDYYNDKLGLGATLDYNKGETTQSMLQGYRENGQDIAMLTLNKHWLKRRLRAQLVYVLPIHWGLSKHQTEMVNTAFYRMQQSLHLGTYDNMLFLRLSFNLHKGKRSRSVADTGIFDDECKTGRNLMGQE